MNRNQALVLAAMAAAFLGCGSAELQASGAKAKPVDNPPFLITEGLPHWVGPLMKRWDDPVLALDPAQKEALLRSRAQTMASVKRLSGATSALEARVVAGSKAQQPPEELRALVEEISRLKAEATMVHLRCLHETRSILSAAQLDSLKQ